MAVYKIMESYRKYKLRSYLRRIEDLFRGVEHFPDFGKSVRWPAPPEVLLGYVETLKRVHRRFGLRHGLVFDVVADVQYYVMTLYWLVLQMARVHATQTHSC